MSIDHHGLGRPFLATKEPANPSQYLGVSQLTEGCRNAELGLRGTSVSNKIV